MRSSKNTKYSSRSTSSSKRSSTKRTSTGYGSSRGYAPSGSYASSSGYASSSAKPLSAGRSTSKGDATSTGEACERQRLEVIVFSGSPVDAPQYRHTGLLIQDLAQDNTTLKRRFLHVTGSAGVFAREEDSRNPRKSELFVGAVYLATIRASGSSLRNAIWSMPVNNADRSWNCQNYVGDALESCAREGLISEEQIDYAIDGMVDLVQQAREEA
ncbi:hypothetical protein F4823DRAFT_620562 [Ustulina deusta]|nr:hypothetical protein F4823DRAFT_620562 [Ustulina deusta]